MRRARAILRCPRPTTERRQTNTSTGSVIASSSRAAQRSGWDKDSRQGGVPTSPPVRRPQPFDVDSQSMPSHVFRDRVPSAQGNAIGMPNRTGVAADRRPNSQVLASSAVRARRGIEWSEGSLLHMLSKGNVNVRVFHQQRDSYASQTRFHSTQTRLTRLRSRAIPSHRRSPLTSILHPCVFADGGRDSSELTCRETLKGISDG